VRGRMGEASAAVALYAAASLGQRLSKLRFITVAKASCSGQTAARFAACFSDQGFAMSGPQRFLHEPKAFGLNRHTILLLVGLVALGIVVSLAFAYYGWAPIE
jgi:hypothetical protein